MLRYADESMKRMTSFLDNRLREVTDKKKDCTQTLYFQPIPGSLDAVLPRQVTFTVHLYYSNTKKNDSIFRNLRRLVHAMILKSPPGEWMPGLIRLDHEGCPARIGPDIRPVFRV